jgi:two-component system response regulator FlrC
VCSSDLPALRDRPGDILPLARHFLAVQGGQAGRNMRLGSEAEAKLAAYAWPGNVRELENVIQRAVIMAPGDVINIESLSLGAPATLASVPQAITAEMVATPVPGAGPANMKDLERQHILYTLAKVGGSRKKAVELLGISERTLRYKLAQYRQEGDLDQE